MANVLELIAELKATVTDWVKPLTDAAKAVTDLAKETDNAGKALDAMAKDATEAAEDVTKLDNADVDNLTDSAEEAAEEVEDVGERAEESEEKAKKLGGVSLKALWNQFKNLAGAARDFAREVGESVERIGKRVAIGSAAIGLAIAAPLAAAANQAAEFRHAFAEVTTLLDQPTPELLNNLRTGAEDLSREFGTSVVDSTKAMYQAISAGIDPAKVLDFLRNSAAAAKGGITDLTTAVDLGTNVLNAYGLDAGKLNQVLDATFVAVKVGKTTFGEMSHAIGRAAPIAAQAGVSYDQLAAAIAAVTLSGLNTNEAVTGVRSALANVLKPTSEATKLAEKLGIQFDASAMQAKGFQRFVDDMMRAIERSGMNATEVLTQLFGDIQGANAIMALTANSGANFNKVLDAMGQKAGASAGAFEAIKANDPTFVFAQLTQEVAAFVRLIGDQVLVFIGPLVEKIREIITAVVDWTRAHPEITGAVVTSGLALAGLLAVVSAAATGLALLGAAIAALAAVSLPVIAALAVVVLPFFATLAAAAGLVLANWDAIRAWAETHWPAIKEAVVNAIAPIKGAAVSAAAMLREHLVGAFGQILGTAANTFPPVGAMVQGLARWIAEVLIPAIASALKWFIDLGAAIIQALIQNWPQIKEMLASLWGVLTAIVGAVGEFVGLLKDVAIKLAGAFSDKEVVTFADAFGRFLEEWNKWVDALKYAWEYVKAIFQTLRDLVSLDFSKFTNLFKDGNFGKLWDAAFAEGGVVTGPTVALLGEAGPEAVIPLSGGAVPVQFTGAALASAPASIGRGGNAGGNTFHTTIVQRPNEDGEAVARRVTRYILDRMEGL